MSCEEFLSLIDSMLDGELSVESTARVNGHADQCVTCGPERDRLIVLHQRMEALADEIEMPKELERRIKTALIKEVKSSDRTAPIHLRNYLKSPRLLTAAAALFLIAVGSYMVNSSTGPSHQKIAQTASSSSLVSAADLAQHTQLHVVSDFQYSPDQLPALIKQTGFAIKPPSLPDWRLASICVCSIGKDGLPVAHMTYVSVNKEKKIRVLTCYQVLGKNFDNSGMSKQSGHAVNPVWSSKISNLAVAFVKGHEVENIFVGVMPLNDVISIAGNS